MWAPLDLFPKQLSAAGFLAFQGPLDRKVRADPANLGSDSSQPGMSLLNSSGARGKYGERGSVALSFT